MSPCNTAPPATARTGNSVLPERLSGLCCSMGDDVRYYRSADVEWKFRAISALHP